MTYAVRFAGAERESRTVGRAHVGGPFTLATHTGAPFSERDLLGKWSLVYFGFTNCPDICPAELDKIGEVLGDLGAPPLPHTPFLLACLLPITVHCPLSYSATDNPPQRKSTASSSSRSSSPSTPRATPPRSWPPTCRTSTRASSGSSATGPRPRPSAARTACTSPRRPTRTRKATIWSTTASSCTSWTRAARSSRRSGRARQGRRWWQGWAGRSRSGSGLRGRGCRVGCGCRPGEAEGGLERTGAPVLYLISRYCSYAQNNNSPLRYACAREPGFHSIGVPQAHAPRPRIFRGITPPAQMTDMLAQVEAGFHSIR